MVKRYSRLAIYAIVGGTTFSCANSTEPLQGTRGPLAIEIVQNCPVVALPDISSLKVATDVTYYRPSALPQLLDVAWREDSQNNRRGIVVFIHGGAWREGSRRDFSVEMLQAANMGYLSASVDYRLTPLHQFPAPVDDVQCAVRYLKRLAAVLSFDSSRVVLVGLSAGGQIALIAAAAPSNSGNGCPDLVASPHVTGVASISGIYDLRTSANVGADLRQALIAYLGGIPENIPTIANAASPIVRAVRADAPVLMIHGRLDFLIPISQPRIYGMRLRDLNIGATLVELTTGGHYLPPFDPAISFRTSTCTLQSFLETRLGPQ